MSWFYRSAVEKTAAASLCNLAGTVWVRDRMTWCEIEPGREQFARATRYDESARIESEAGLRVLQVQHSTPAWAGMSSKHFPEDLRDIYRFLRYTAAHWKGRVQAFEPWNEADIDMFGGHTGAEMASLQKAAYLGRSVPPQGRALRLSPAPIYAVLPPGAGQQLTLTAPPTMPQRQEAKPSPVVLQSIWPRDRVALNKSAYRAVTGEDTTVPVFAYNFSDLPVAGKLTVVAPKGWDISIRDRVELAAGERKQLAMHVHRPVVKGDNPERIQITGDFGPAGDTVLSIRIQLETKKRSLTPLANSAIRGWPAFLGGSSGFRIRRRSPSPFLR